MTEVKPGQVWADNDPREEGRTLRVERIEDDKAICTVLSNRSVGSYTASVGRITRISLRRFRPTSTGYRLVEGGAE